MKNKLEELITQVVGKIHEGEFAVDYRNKAFVRINVGDLQVDLHKYGDVCLTYRGADTKKAYLLAMKAAVSAEYEKINSKSLDLFVEMRNIDKELEDMNNESTED